MAAAGQDVVLVARGAQLEAIRARGLRVDGSVRVQGRPRVVGSGAQLPDVDLLLLTTKTYDSVGALAGVAPERVGAAASLQNGILKDELLAERFGRAKVIGCATMVGAQRTAPGQVRCFHFGDTFFGELGGEPSARIEAVRRGFAGAGLNVRTSDRILSLEWTKQVLQAANAPGTAITRQPLHEYYLTAAAAIYVQIVREAAAVPAKLGIELDTEYAWGGPVKELLDVDDEAAVRMTNEFGQRLLDQGADNIRISMQQDVVAGRRTEIEETAGYVLREAHRLGLQAPYLDFACQAIRAMTPPF
jgi:2-dehydropantoate 2-reductase